MNPTYPAPAALAKLAPLTRTLMSAAQEYDQVSQGELTTAVEFVTGIDLDAQLALHSTSPGSLRHAGRAVQKLVKR